MATLARWCFRHRLLVLLMWLVTLGGVAVASQSAGSAYASVFHVPDTESGKAQDLVKAAFPESAGDMDTVVWRVDEGTVRDAAVRERMSASLERIDRLDTVGSVTSPYSRAGATQISRDGRTAYARITYHKTADELSTDEADSVVDTATEARTEGLRVEVSGPVAEKTEEGEAGSVAEVVGLVAAAIVLYLAFGSLPAMLLPLISALFSVGTGVMSIKLLSHVADVPELAATLSTLIGLGVGIDYALFIITRHRQCLKSGLAPEEAAVRALNTSGRAVLFAGGTVCIALLGLLALRLEFLTGVAIATTLMVVLTMAASVTFMPALLGLFGMRVLSRRERRRPTAEGPRAEQPRGLAVRWAALVQRRPVTLLTTASVVLAVLTIPFFSLRLGISDQGNRPESNTTRQAYDMLEEGFGPGFNGPLQLVAKVGGPDDQAALQRLAGTVRKDPDVATVVSLPARPDATRAVVQVIPRTAPQEEATSDLIARLRDTTIPAAERGTTLAVYVGGQTATFDDFATVMIGKLPWFVLIVVALGFLLLLVAFRSLVIPLTAAVMNLLAAGASFGVLVALFQWGRLSGPLGVGGAGPVEAFLPTIMLAVLFGLSMDYQVFLVSRVHEEWVHSHDNSKAVTVGLTNTSRVINAAALIMICVFFAFVFRKERIISEFGVGLAAAVALDAFVIRTMLVPAVMRVLGAANWWLPGWLDKRLPHLAVEPADPPTPAPAADRKQSPATPAPTQPRT
ncbi:MMPL family transporter [Streptomyces luteolifulvus]|uniref:MMPL family transporter n=1 Tax=Streptomyces luteolifulvus TaxID=2615112 RepID=A0A6H9UTE0_9ACTN|nr:MMPL family transporter [Streptomyces luteolifulvus]KAB1142363.1 MMPL family transporter [Streptomyces luteolifulvus]